MKQLLPFALIAVLALASMGMAQQKAEPEQLASSPLVRLLQSKGLITEQEAVMVSEAATPDEVERRLAKLLLAKGVLNQQEYEQTISSLAARAPIARPAPEVVPVVFTPNGAAPKDQLNANADARSSTAIAVTAAPEQNQPKVVPAVAPLRLLPITIPKKEGLVPDLKLGSSAKLRPYGFFKVSAVEQTASHGGPTFGSNDFPLGPLLLGDTGPDADAQFHIKTARCGWVLISSGLIRRIT